MCARKFYFGLVLLVSTLMHLQSSYCIEAFVAPPTTSTTTSSHSLTSTVPTATPTWIEKGCYLDTGVARTLANRTTIAGGDAALMPEACEYACWIGGFTYAGVEAGSECWCGNSIRNEIATDSNTTCIIPCAGDSQLVCGGDGRVDVFQGIYPTSTTIRRTASTTIKSTTSTTSISSTSLVTATSASGASR